MATAQVLYDPQIVPPPRPRRHTPRLLRVAWLLPLLLTAAIVSYFAYQARYDEQFRYYAYHWKAHWVTTNTPDSDAGYFRTTFDLNASPKTAYLVIAANNAFGVRVNGQRTSLMYVSPEESSFLPGELSQFSHEGTEPTNYAAFGNMRRGSLGHLENIASLLTIGKNVVAISAVSDEGSPEIAAEIVINDGQQIIIPTDGSWKSAPISAAVRGHAWYSPMYVDRVWSNVVDTGQTAAVPIDGDASALSEPLQGFFIGSNQPASEKPLTFQSMVNCSATGDRGWLRISSSADYDITLNGVTIASQSTQDRYRQSLLARQKDDYESFDRVRTAGMEDGIPGNQSTHSIDLIELKDLFRQGSNDLRVILHPNQSDTAAPLPEFDLDGQVLLKDGVRQAIQTNAAWRELNGSQAVPVRTDFQVGTGYDGFQKLALAQQMTPGKWSEVRVVRNAFILFLLCVLLGYGAAALLGLDKASSNTGESKIERRLNCVGALFIPPAIILATALTLQFVFEFSEQDQIFSTQVYAWRVIEAAFAAGVLSTAVAWLQSRRRKQPGDVVDLFQPHPHPVGSRISRLGLAIARGNRSYGGVVVMSLIVTAAVLFTTHSLTTNSLIPDEYVSILAAKGILRRGIPIYVNTNIVYTRSALFHYILATILPICQHYGNLAYARLLGTFWQIALIPLIYVFGREINGRATGLVAALLVAFSPYEVFLGREVRFYTEFAFFSTLTLYYMYRSLTNPENDKYRRNTVLAYCLAYMSQELAISLVPALVLAVVLSGQARYWMRWNNVAWLGVAVLMTGADFYTYSHYCVTPLPYIDGDSEPAMAIHTDSVELIASTLFLNIERTQAVVAGLYIIGLLWTLGRYLFVRSPLSDSLRRRSLDLSWRTYLYLISIPTILFTSFTAHAAGRYTVQIAPIVSLAAACVIIEIAKVVKAGVRRPLRSPLVARFVVALYAVSVATACAAAYRPERTWNAMSRTENRDDTVAVRYIKQHMKPSDKVMAFDPEICMVEIGRCDYHWRPMKESRDKYISLDGALRERDSGALEIENSDKLRNIMLQHNRIWLLVPPRVLRVENDSNATEMQYLLQNNWQIQFERQNIQVWLWDPGKGVYNNTVYDYGYDSFND